ncbi:Importin-4 [Pteropus alecto]|uniref:Transmembrane 9 superfamily member 1 n=1 Tax=Pteropus alecto TaxID=9402 RepID=L5KKY0_PTEAL|nr:Importin-4 [Pteropus alecto]
MTVLGHPRSWNCQWLPLMLLLGTGHEPEVEGVTHYKAGDPVILYVNKVGPYHNPQETYHYYQLPVCCPEKIRHKSLSLGEVLDGDRMAESLYEIRFRENAERRILCHMQLSSAQVEQLRQAIEELYYFEFVVDDLPLRGFVGYMEESGFLPHSHKIGLWTHLDFHLEFHGDRIIFANVSVRDVKPHSLDGLRPDEFLGLTHTYSVRWSETSVERRSDRRRGDDGGFFPRTLEIHWLSIINSMVLVFLLVGFVAVILMRVLRNDLARYNLDEETTSAGSVDDFDQGDNGWKIIHTDVFRFPPYRGLLCAVLGVGAQFLALGTGIIVMALLGMFNVHRHGAINSAAILLYALTCCISGYVSSHFYRQIGGERWVWNIILTTSLFSVPFFLTWSVVNSVHWANGSTQALPATTILLLLTVWLLVGFPLTIIGGIFGKNNASPFDAPCRTKNIAREIPPQPWYKSTLIHMTVGGFLPFSAISVELYYIFATVWGREQYTLYGILFFVFAILLSVGACISIALTYFQLSGEDYRGGSAATMEPAGLERILRELLLPDTERIRRATEQLQVALRDPASLPALCDLLASAADPQIRQFAALLTRRRLNARWRRLAEEHRERHNVSLSLAQLSATIFRKEGLEAWPQLMQLLQHNTHSPHIPEREMGLLLLSVVVTSRPEAFRPHHRELLQLLNETLGEVGSPGLLFYSLRTLTTMAPYLGTDDVPLARMLVPKLIMAMQTLILVDEAKACEAMEALDELLESEVPVITSHLSEVLTFCLEVARNMALGDAIRVRILCCLTFLVKVKSKALLKNRLLPSLLHTLFPIMAAEPPLGQLDPEDQDSEEEELEIGLLGETPKHFAVQVVDMLALHLPPEKLCPLLMPMLEEALRSESPYQRKAGLLVLAVLSDGAGDHIRQRLLPPLLQIVCKGLEDPSQVVRNAALFALGQFSENLQPHISSYSGEVMPLLLAYLKSVPPGHTHHLAKACYALENFVENLGPKVQPYLPELMECMLQPLRNTSTPRAKELAVSALGAIATAAQASLLPYFPTIMEHLREFLVTGHEDLQPVRIQSLETLGVLARAVGEPMKSLAEECCQLGLGLCDQVDDPDLRRCTYSLFAALSGLMGEGLAPYLPQITTLMLLSLRSTEGIVPQYDGSSSFLLFDDESDGEEEEELMDEGEEEEDDSEISGYSVENAFFDEKEDACAALGEVSVNTSSFLLFDDESDGEEEEELMDEGEEEEDDSEISGYSVENAFFDEKEDACAALGEVSVNTSVAFLPYMESVFEEVFRLLECPHLNVRKAAHEALGQFCCALHKACQSSPSEPNTAALQAALAQVVPSYMQAVYGERERQVVMAVLEALTGVLRSCGTLTLQPPGRLAELCNMLKAVLQRKTACQDTDDDEEEDEDQAEYDAMLLEHAGEAIPALASVAGGDAFAPFFAGFLPLLLCKTKQGCTVAEKSFAVGTLAESIQGLGAASAQFVSRLLPVLLSAAREADPEVRSNAIFGLGVLAEHGGRPAQDHFSKLLGLLLPLLARERHDRVRDNICGALARLLMASPTKKPEPQVLAALLHALPLKEDLEEWVTIGHLFSFLYQSSPDQVVDVAPELLRICSLIQADNKIPPDTKAALLLLLTFLAKQHTDSFHSALGSLPSDKAQELQDFLSLN